MSASPVVYFIDDSATMREVIKIAFRRENINVVACHDANSALGMMDQTTPDVVISDVIMPERDGYDVCQYIKQHPVLAKTPVILMSGVVNRSVAEKAFSVKADELIRKPFQPQDLITRVRHLLHNKTRPRTDVAGAPPTLAQATAAAALSSIFQSQGSSRPGVSRPSLAVIPRTAKADVGQSTAAEAASRAISSGSPAPSNGAGGNGANGESAATSTPRVPNPPGYASGGPANLKVEVLRLQSQIKKLETELRAEREYARALEEHIKTLQEAD